jgi:hypothetical protein
LVSVESAVLEEVNNRKDGRKDGFKSAHTRPHKGSPRNRLLGLRSSEGRQAAFLVAEAGIMRRAFLLSAGAELSRHFRQMPYLTAASGIGWSVGCENDFNQLSPIRSEAARSTDYIM